MQGKYYVQVKKWGVAQALFREISVPTMREIALLGKNTLRSIDPGFELVTGIGRRFATKFIAFLNKDKKTMGLAEKLASTRLLERLPMPSQSALSARLPHSEIYVPIEKISRENHQGVYVLVNPDTGALAGKRFRLSQDNQLIPMHNQNTMPQRLILNDCIPKLKSTYLLYNNPWKPIEFDELPVNGNPEEDEFVEHIGVSLLTDFLPLRFDNVLENRINVDFNFYRENVLQNYYPEQ
ncbi:MAG: hypothetical protein ACMZI0_06575 [Symbiopectobacterium sp.]|uniref:hypothetical protein n=1 Tax=Symbiopectobacterium sp. TaxID=2952789 RepID=UPI0039EB72ED